MGTEYPGKLCGASSHPTTPCVVHHTRMAEDVPAWRECSPGEGRRTDLQRVASIKRSLERNDFVLHRQPIVNLFNRDDRRQRCEILLRLKNHGGGLSKPGSFLETAEKFGLMPRIDRWVFDSMMDWMSAGDPAEIESTTFYINVSGMSVRDNQFRSHVIETLRERRMSGQRICFELTETAAVSSLAGAARFIERIRELGHSCALDDFGSGLSSFAYLKNLPVDYLKIDGQFVRNIAEDKIDLAIVTSVTELARAMKIRTVAEFAETAPALVRLREIGVDFAQGYAVGRPRPLSHHVDTAFRLDADPAGSARLGF